MRLWVWPVVALLGCGSSSPAPLSPPGGSAVSSAEPTPTVPIAPEVEGGASDGSEPVAKVRSGKVVELAPGVPPEPPEPPECRVALDCMLDAQGLPRPVRNAAERAQRARFRPCETGESTAGCRDGRCVPMHYGC